MNIIDKAIAHARIEGCSVESALEQLGYDVVPSDIAKLGRAAQDIQRSARGSWAGDVIATVFEYAGVERP